MLTTISPDQAYAFHAALIQARAWFEHFKTDVQCGLMPYPDSIDVAIAGINDVIGPPVAANREIEETANA